MKQFVRSLKTIIKFDYPVRWPQFLEICISYLKQEAQPK